MMLAQSHSHTRAGRVWVAHETLCTSISLNEYTDLLMTALSVGTVRAAAGKIKYGTWDLIGHPTGGVDQLPVIIAQGDPKGPVIWLTAGLHGNEHAGLQVLHLLLDAKLVKKLHGTIVAIPALNPAGLRTVMRKPYYHDGDPNRLFPDGKSHPLTDPDIDPPGPLEQAYARLFEEIQQSAYAWIDLHNAWTGSMSFIYRDRVFYRTDLKTAAENQKAKQAAEVLDNRINEMCVAYGHSIVNEMPPEAYFGENLHRSSTGSAVNIARIPGMTLELGTGHMPDPRHVHGCMSGLRNVLRWAGMLDGDWEEITGVKIVKPGYACRRRGAPRTTVPCIVRHLLEPGDLVTVGQPVAEMRDIWGRPVAEKILYSDVEGYVMGRSHGVVYYAGHEIYGFAIRDDLPTVLPYPKNYFQ